MRNLLIVLGILPGIGRKLMRSSRTVAVAGLIPALCLGTLLASFWFPWGAFAQDQRPKIAVVTFKNPPNYATSTIGDGLTSMVISELSQTGKFALLEREHVEELTKEMDFGGSDYAKSSSFAQKGRMLGAQYILMGEVTNFSYSETGEEKRQINLFGPDQYYIEYQQIADVRVDFRLVDVASGETVLSEAGKAHETNRGRVSEEGIFLRSVRAQFAVEFPSSLIGRATASAAKDVVRKLNSLSASVREVSQQARASQAMERLASVQGEVLGDAGGGLWIVGVGSAAGMQKGDRLKVTHENVTKDKAGRVLYKKPMEIGSMEITDVSMADRAEARFLAGPASGSMTPQVNDLVRVDADYARALRGGSGPAVAAGSPTAPVSALSGGGQIEQVLKRAESYLKDNFASQALEEYNKAAALNAHDTRAFEGQALAHYLLGDFTEGEEGAQKVIESGGRLAVPVAHYHSMGLCLGELTIQHGKLAFQSDKADGFEVGPAGLAGVEVHKLSKPLIANEKAPDWPILEIRWRDSGGHEKKYQLIPYMYAKQQDLSGKNLASAFPMDDSDVHEMQRLEQSLVTLIQQSVK